MKNIKLLSLFTLVTLGALFITSCGDTTGDNPTPKPVLNYLAGSEYISQNTSLAANVPFKIAITASHTDNITSFKIIQSLDGSVDVELFDSADIRTKLISEYIFNGTTGENAGTEIYTFTVSDKDGNTTSKSITITNLGDPGLGLDVFEFENDGTTPFRVYNFRGVKSGAYGITIGGNVLSNEPNSDKDIQDSTALAETSNWPARWTSRNGTTFKKVDASSWASITNDAEIEAAWTSASGAEATFVSVAKGDVYLLNLKNAGDYALVEITDVVSTPGADNNDYVQFKYKKQQ